MLSLYVPTSYQYIASLMEICLSVSDLRSWTELFQHIIFTMNMLSFVNRGNWGDIAGRRRDRVVVLVPKCSLSFSLLLLYRMSVMHVMGGGRTFSPTPSLEEAVAQWPCSHGPLITGTAWSRAHVCIAETPFAFPPVIWCLMEPQSLSLIECKFQVFYMTQWTPLWSSHQHCLAWALILFLACPVTGIDLALAAQQNFLAPIGLQLYLFQWCQNLSLRDWVSLPNLSFLRCPLCPGIPFRILFITFLVPYCVRVPKTIPVSMIHQKIHRN